MKYIAYYRVSTQRQGESGLGLEAQQAAVRDFLKGAEPLQAFTEIESGRNAQRPQLREAIEACKRHKARLVIAKLDRLARNVHFVSGLMESGVDFVAVDNPTATKLTIHILAAVAEDEAERISKRTKEALQAAKKRGKKLGGYRGGTISESQREASKRSRQEQARRKKLELLSAIEKIKAEKGGLGNKALARELAAREIPTPSGAGVWDATKVRLVLNNSLNV